MTWRDHEVCCSGGCGTVLEDCAGNTITEAAARFENTTTDGTPIMLLFCHECAVKHDQRPTGGEMIRKALDAVERWVLDEDNSLIAVGKMFLVAGVAIALVALPFVLLFGGGDSAEATCQRAGNGWAIAGEHREMRYNPALKMPTMVTVTDYACYPVIR